MREIPDALKPRPFPNSVFKHPPQSRMAFGPCGPFYQNPLLGTGFSSVGLAVDNDYLRVLAQNWLFFRTLCLRSNSLAYFSKPVHRISRPRFLLRRFHSSHNFGVSQSIVKRGIHRHFLGFQEVLYNSLDLTWSCRESQDFMKNINILFGNPSFSRFCCSPLQN